MIKFGIGPAVRRGRPTLPYGPGALRRRYRAARYVHGVNVLFADAHARIRKVDASKARAAPGVLLVLGGRHVRTNAR